jgi:hypothetical protein
MKKIIIMLSMFFVYQIHAQAGLVRKVFEILKNDDTRKKYATHFGAPMYEWHKKHNAGYVQWVSFLRTFFNKHAFELDTK